MNNKKNTAIVFGFTSNFSFAVACVMMDLKKYFKSGINEVVILHDGISASQQRILNNILPCRFIKYAFPIKDSSKFNKKTLNYFSKMVFSKFECFKLLDDYKNVVWLDYDIVITEDISELINFCDSGIKMMLSGSKVLTQFYKSIEGYNMEIEGFSAGTFVLQDNLSEYHKIYNFCYKKTEEYAKLLNFPEQAILDIMIQEFKLKPDIIDKEIYCVHPNETNKHSGTKIIHSYGQIKFWNGIYNENWNLNYKNWLKMGGQKYNLNYFLVKKNISNFLKKLGLYENIKNLLLKVK